MLDRVALLKAIFQKKEKLLQKKKDGSINQIRSFLVKNLNKFDIKFKKISPFKNPYTIAATDGSQVYPSQQLCGASDFFLINTGHVVFSYDEQSKFHGAAMPEIFSRQMFPDNFSVSNGFVDRLRFLRELEMLYSTLKSNVLDVPIVGLVDGNLCCDSDQDDCCEKCENIFKKFYDSGFLIAGYVSDSKNDFLSKKIFEMSSLENFGLKNPVVISDIFILDGVLFQGQRTSTIESKNNKEFCYVYLNVGYEIARIEFPSWVGRNSCCVDFICSVILDQVEKGFGYPVCLSEAHEKAVVRGGDKRFFYELLQEVLGVSLRISGKVLSKRWPRV